MVRIVLELVRGNEVIEGRALAGDGGAEPFFGWTELVALLDRLRAAPDTVEPGSPPNAAPTGDGG